MHQRYRSQAFQPYDSAIHVIPGRPGLLAQTQSDIRWTEHRVHEALALRHNVQFEIPAAEAPPEWPRLVIRAGALDPSGDHVPGSDETRHERRVRIAEHLLGRAA